MDDFKITPIIIYRQERKVKWKNKEFCQICGVNFRTLFVNRC